MKNLETIKNELGLNRVYLNVPFEEKEEAKKLGCKWDGDTKSWFSDKFIPEYQFFANKSNFSDNTEDFITKYAEQQKKNSELFMLNFGKYFDISTKKIKLETSKRTDFVSMVNYMISKKAIKENEKNVEVVEVESPKGHIKLEIVSDSKFLFGILYLNGTFIKKIENEEEAINIKNRAK
jgi:predicted CopG family antitoxin